MILLLGMLAHAQPADPVDGVPAAVEGASEEAVPADPEALRLLGDTRRGELEAAEAPAAPTGPLGNGWPIGVLVVAAGLLYLGRKKLLQRATTETGSELRIVGRTTLGPQAGLAVVEVRGRDGNWRRLVVGTGDGAPSLVADLGEPAFGFLGMADDELSQLDDGFPALGAPEGLRATLDEGPRSEPPELDAHARRLIDEVLGERVVARRSTFKTQA